MAFVKALYIIGYSFLYPFISLAESVDYKYYIYLILACIVFFAGVVVGRSVEK